MTARIIYMTDSETYYDLMGYMTQDEFKSSLLSKINNTDIPEDLIKSGDKVIPGRKLAISDLPDYDTLRFKEENGGMFNILKNTISLDVTYRDMYAIQGRKILAARNYLNDLKECQASYRYYMPELSPGILTVEHQLLDDLYEPIIGFIVGDTEGREMISDIHYTTYKKFINALGSAVNDEFPANVDNSIGTFIILNDVVGICER